MQVRVLPQEPRRISMVENFVLIAMTYLQMVGVIFIFEFLVHYHMDWFKMMWCKEKGYSGYVPQLVPGRAVLRLDRPHLAIYSNKYFLWLGIDQLVHYLTYVAMIWLWVS